MNDDTKTGLVGLGVGVVVALVTGLPLWAVALIGYAGYEIAAGVHDNVGLWKRRHTRRRN